MESTALQHAWIEAARGMLQQSANERLHPLWFRAGGDVMSTFDVDQSTAVASLADLPVFPMETSGLALVTCGNTLTAEC